MNLMNQENFFIDLNLLVAITLKQQIKKYGKEKRCLDMLFWKTLESFCRCFIGHIGDWMEIYEMTDISSLGTSCLYN